VSVTLVIPHAKRMRRIILSRPTKIFLHYLINGKIFRKDVIKHTICTLIFSRTSTQTFLVLRRIERDIIINVHIAWCKFPLFLLDFNQNCIFLVSFRKKKIPQISNYTKTREVGAEIFHASRRKDAQTDKDERT